MFTKRTRGHRRVINRRLLRRRNRAIQGIAFLVLLSWSFSVVLLSNSVEESSVKTIQVEKEAALENPPKLVTHMARTKSIMNRVKREANRAKIAQENEAKQAEIAEKLANGEVCSCENEFKRCCLRGLIGVHKMGLFALHTIQHKHFPMLNTIELANNPFGDNFRETFLHPVGDDYRMVVVTRNWYDALISGYLYHKAGKECWLDVDGSGVDKGWFNWLPGAETVNYSGWLAKTEKWEERIKPAYSQQPWPSGRGRDLCTYLSEVSEMNGMRVYVEWALSSYMRPLLEFTRGRKDSELKNGYNRTLFLCLEKLSNPGAYVQTVQSINDWMYPGGIPTYRKGRPGQPITAPSEKYNGGHGTSHNPRLRQRLRKIIEKLDNHLYNGALALGNAEFGCEAEIS